MYRLFLDKENNFECNIKIQGAPIDKTVVRLVVESSSGNVIYPGKINSDGICSVKVHNLKTFLNESSTGNIKLEVIADNTYFVPWTSEYVTDVDKKVEVSFNKDKKEDIEEQKTILVEEVQVNKQEIKSITKKDILRESKDIVKILLKNNINTVKKIHENKTKVIRLIKEHNNSNIDSSKLLGGVVNIINKLRLNE